MKPSKPAELDRRLGTSDAIVIGLGSMLGAGVFATWGPAARAAGTGLLLGLALAAWWSGGHDWYGVLQAAGLLFFAFAGYARIATLGEEVREPRTTIPRAIPLALLIAVVVYAVVGVSILLVAGPDLLTASTSPLVTAAVAAGRPAIEPVVRVGASLASLGALLALMAGIGRTSLAMARERDLPRWLGAVHPRFRVPHHAEVLLAVVVCVLVLVTDLRGALGFSSFGVLIYYAIANVAAFTQPAADRRWGSTSSGRRGA